MRKRHRLRCQVGTGKVSVSEPLWTCRKVLVGIGTGGRTESPGWAWRVPEYWPGGVRHVGGASLVCGSCTERGKAGADTARRHVVDGVPGVRGSASTADTGD